MDKDKRFKLVIEKMYLAYIRQYPEYKEQLIKALTNKDKKGE